MLEDNINRRDFIKTTAVAGALVAATVQVSGFGGGLFKTVKPAVAQSTDLVRHAYMTEGGAQFFYTNKDNRIVRFDPLSYPEAKAWKLTVGNRTFSPPKRSLSKPGFLAYKRYIYNPNRILYPMRRASYQLGKGGETAADRAKGQFVRISWDEAFNTVAAEMKRIKDTYGNGAFCQWSCSHQEFGFVYYTNLITRLFNIYGGYTTRQSAGHSWVGWKYGANFMWGFEWAMCVDMMNEEWNALKNSKLMVYWSTDPMTTTVEGGYDAPLTYGYWFKEMGVKQIFISPNLHDMAAGFADKWISVIPGTDTAVAAAIAYTWIAEDTYDHQYVATHSIGFDEPSLPAGAPPNSSFKAYIMGTSDGIPKTPKWAEAISGVQARTIKTLAREWASKPTYLAACFGSANRTSMGHEWTRMMVALQAMQGLGKPGVGIAQLERQALPRDPASVGVPDIHSGIDWVANKTYTNAVKQVINYTHFSNSILSPPVSWTGGSGLTKTMSVDAWDKYTYPMTGYSEVHMFYTHGGSMASTPPEVGRMIKTLISPKIEFIVNNNFRWDTATTYADIVLPPAMGHERDDLIQNTGNENINVMYTGVPPAGEAKGDLEIYGELANRLGIGDAFNEGNTVETWLRKVLAKTQIPLTYEQLRAKGYYLFELKDGFEPTYALKWFYDQPVGSGLSTPSGKIEFFSQTIFKYEGATNPDCAPVPHYIPTREGRYDPLTASYPLQVLTPHPKFRYHGQNQENEWLRELYKIKGPDGYEHEPVYMNPVDAAARGLKTGDIVRVFNDRGQILGAVVTTQRLVPGVIQIYYGTWCDLVDRTNPASLDRAGNVNLITSNKPMSSHALVVAYNFLAQVERWTQ